jgi:hypothetical protein
MRLRCIVGRGGALTEVGAERGPSQRAPL